MTEQLQTAYSKAGEQMAKQMSAAVVSIIAGITSGHGLPAMYGWSKGKIPEHFFSVIPADVQKEIEWVVVISPEITEIPLLKGEPIWGAELMSGHRLLVLG